MMIPFLLGLLALVLIAAVAFGRMLVYYLAREGNLWALVPTNSNLAIEVGRNVQHSWVTPSDAHMVMYFRWLQTNTTEKPHGRLYKIIQPGQSGLIWKGLPFLTSVSEIADTQELLDVTAEVTHALRMQERELTYDFEPEETELEAIRKEVEGAREANEAAGKRVKTVSPDKVRKLQYVPNQKTADMIEVRVRLSVYIQSVDPLLSVTQIQFPQDMIRGKIIPVLRQVMSGLNFYKLIEEEGVDKSGTDLGKKKAEAERLLISLVQTRLRLALGLHWNGQTLPFDVGSTGKPKYLDISTAQVTPQGDDLWNVSKYPQKPEEYPVRGSVVYQILDDWGYYIRDVLVEDVQEEHDSITKALTAVVEETAKAQASIRRAEGQRQTDIIEGQGKRARRILEGEGDRGALEAQISAFGKGDELTSEKVEAFQAWFKLQALQANVQGSNRTFVVWPDLPTGLRSMGGVLDHLKAAIASNPALLDDEAALGRLLKNSLGATASAAKTDEPTGGQA